MKNGIILQVRDFEILQTVYESTVSSFEQLRLKHFSATNLQTASNRLGRLVKGGYLKNYRVGLVIYQGKERQVNRIFRVTGLGIQALSMKTRAVVYRTDPVTPRCYSLMHDLLLNEVQENLKKENPTLKIVNTKLLKMVPSKTEQIPDLAMEGESRELNQAIELELTVKSEKRYREITTNYRLSSRWKKVLFICQDDQIQNKIRNLIAGKNSVTAESESQIGKFYFRSLDSVLRFTPSVNVIKPTEEKSAA